MSTKYKASDLVKFFQSKIGTNYVYGMRGSVMTKEKYYELKKQYGSMVWDSDIKKCGTVCVDCSGMFEWFMGISKSSSGWYTLFPPLRMLLLGQWYIIKDISVSTWMVCII